MSDQSTFRPEIKRIPWGRPEPGSPQWSPPHWRLIVWKHEEGSARIHLMTSETELLPLLSLAECPEQENAVLAALSTFGAERIDGKYGEEDVRYQLTITQDQLRISDLWGECDYVWDQQAQRLVQDIN